MAKKVIQVPVDKELLKNLDNLSKKQRKARSEIIREACARYLHQVENEALDGLYRQGYARVPEDPQVGEAQAGIAAEVLTGESW